MDLKSIGKKLVVCLSLSAFIFGAGLPVATMAEAAGHGGPGGGPRMSSHGGPGGGPRMSSHGGPGGHRGPSHQRHYGHAPSRHHHHHHSGNAGAVIAGVLIGAAIASANSDY